MKIGYIVAGVVLSLIFLLLRRALRRKNGIRWVNFLEGYRKESYDEEGLLRFLGDAMLVWAVGGGGCWIAGGVLGLDWLYRVGLAFILAVAVFLLAFLNTGNRFRK
ncbi:MAG TPA: DUF3784 domain-containing protein [Oscillospiraceae bacterium]|nr:DUF3784 domain-containing protein [Oscillospiraceae bacterium]